MTVTLNIQNLKCNGCANTIITKLSDLEFINEVKVDHEDSSVSFLYENELALTNAKKLLAKLGYPEVGDKNALATKAKSFVSCAIGRMNG